MSIKPIALITLSFLFLLTALTGCSKKQKFTKEFWREGDGITYSKRKLIYEDLLANYKLKGMHYKDVIRLLGKPDATDSLKTSYQVINTDSEYNPEKDSIYRMNLEFYFSKDSAVTRTAIYERKSKLY